MDNPGAENANAVEVAAGLVFRDGKLLITQRYPEAHLGGLWEFPGGKREPDESFTDCLKRELFEELGIKVEPGELVERISHVYPEKRVLLEFYRCKWLCNEPQALGCPAFRWVTQAELERYLFPEADARIVGRLSKESTLWE